MWFGISQGIWNFLGIIFVAFLALTGITIQSFTQLRLGHVNKAVNNVSPGEPTLKDKVDAMHDRQEKLDADMTEVKATQVEQNATLSAIREVVDNRKASFGTPQQKENRYLEGTS